MWGRGGGGRRSEGRRGLHLRKASRGLEGGFKGPSAGLERGLKPSALKGGFEVQGGLKGAKGPSGGVGRGLKPSALKGGFEDA